MKKKKVAVIVYHKRAQELYPQEWLNQFKESILNQTYQDFDIFEFNYGKDSYKIFDYGCLNNGKYTEFQGGETGPITFVDTMNLLLDYCFSHGYDYVFNTNVDDYFALNRIERQLIFLEQGYDIVASNFYLVRDGQIYHSHRMNEQNIRVELERNNNPIGHPVVAYSRRFWGKIDMSQMKFHRKI